MSWPKRVTHPSHKWMGPVFHDLPGSHCAYCDIDVRRPEAHMQCPNAEKMFKKEAEDKVKSEYEEYMEMRAKLVRLLELDAKLGDNDVCDLFNIPFNSAATLKVPPAPTAINKTETPAPPVRQLSNTRQLDAAVAFYLFGWRWYKHPERPLCGFYPPENSGWTRWNFEPALEEFQTAWPDGRYSDWDKLATLDTKHERARNELPHYAYDIGDAFEVVSHLRRLGFRLTLVQSPRQCIKKIPDDPGVQEVWVADFKDDKGSHHDAAIQPATAVCLAALRATGKAEALRGFGFFD